MRGFANFIEDTGMKRLVLVGAMLAWLGCSDRPQRGTADKPVPNGAIEHRDVPLESVYSTIGQRGLKPMSRAFKLENDGTRKYVEPYGRALDEINSQFGSGGSDLLLVRGKDLAAAVWATQLALLGGRSFAKPVDPEDGSAAAQVWLVVYFGTAGSSPPAWSINAIQQKGTTLRVSFSEPKRVVTTQDRQQYFAWALLGEIQAGEYALELFDVTRSETVLLRRVTILPK